MDPCLALCSECVYCKSDQKRMICGQSKFNVKLYDGMLFVPFDFDCLEFEKKIGTEYEKK